MVAQPNDELHIVEPQDAPRLDRRRLTRKSSKYITRLNLQIQKANSAGDNDGIASLLDEFDSVIFQIVSYVPRSWFADAAPDDISIDTPEWWDYLITDKYDELLELVKEGQRKPGQDPI